MSDRRGALALSLERARKGLETVAQPSSSVSLGVEEAYEVQRELLKLRTADGEKVVGYKMGLTSKAKMRQMGVDSPIMGFLTDGMRLDGSFSLGRAVQPRIEPEIAFLVGREIAGPLPPREALSRCSAVCAALEILDSRYRDFKFKLEDVIADNGSGCAFALGPWTKNPGFEALQGLAVTLKVDGLAAQQGLSDDIYGHPAQSLSALSALLARRGLALPEGCVVLAGAATQAISLRPGLYEGCVAGFAPASVSVSA
ncbi:MAG: fumarylacetoacetate hydrolase family protein [Elusimicrobia bacterium]|nr:fumarylacetoacetate hydrolase family protein [Elusimicrobiota bacterium]